MINKDTKLYGSFSQKAGSKGCEFFNKEFARHNLNSIYKSFSVNSIKNAVEAAITLKMSGFAISMPYKKEVLSHCDELSSCAKEIGAANTVINRFGNLTAHNTDYLAVIKLLSDYPLSGVNDIFVLGNGGYSAAVKFAIKNNFIKLKIFTVTRENWKELNKLRNKLIFNCTPVANIGVHHSNLFIDCLISSKTGLFLSKAQASYQFKLYTGINIIK